MADRTTDRRREHGRRSYAAQRMQPARASPMDPRQRRNCSQRVRGWALAKALDRDELVARGGAVGGGYRSGDLIPIDLAEGRCLHEVPRLAIGSRNCEAAIRSRREATVNTVAVGIVRDDED